MADELEPIEQVFDAELSPYIDELKRGLDEIRQFADDNRLAAGEVQDLGARAEETAREIQDFADRNRLAIEGLAELRDRAVEDGAALGDLRDHAAEAAAEEDALRDKSAEAAAELGHLRDNAAGASHEVKKLGDASLEAKAKMDLLGLSGLATHARLFGMVGLIGTLIGAGMAVTPVLAAASLGLAGIGAAAMAAYNNVQPAVQALGTLNNLPPGTVQYARALAMANAQLKNLDPSARAFAVSINNAKNAFQSWGDQMTPLVSRVLTPWLNMLPKILNLFQQLAQATAGPLIQMAHNISAALDSKPFQQFMHTMMALIGPALTALGHLSTALLKLLGGALEALAPLAVPFVNMLTAIVSALSGPLISLFVIFQQLLLAIFDALRPLIPGLSQFATALIQDVGQGMVQIIPILGQIIALLGPALLKILMDLLPVLANFLTPNSPFIMALNMIPPILRAILPLFTFLAAVLAHPIFATLAVDILSAIVAGMEFIKLLKLLEGSFIVLGATFEATPIGWVVTAIAALVFAFYELWKHSEAFRDFWKTMWHDIQAVVSAVWAVIKPLITDDIRIIRDVVTAVMDIIQGKWGAAWKAIKDAVSTQLKLIETLIKDAAKVFLTLLEQAGKDIVMGLIRGIESMIPGLSSAVGDIANTVKNVIGTILHIFSPSAVLYTHGVNIMTGLIYGITSQMPRLRSTMDRVAQIMTPGSMVLPSYGGPAMNAVGAGYTPGVGGGLGLPSGNLIINVDGKQLLSILAAEIYQYNIRNSGQVTGTVKPV